MFAEFWSPQTEDLCDVRITDADALSYVDHPVAAVLVIAGKEKVKYLPAAEAHHASFTYPFCGLCGWAMRREASAFLQ